MIFCVVVSFLLMNNNFSFAKKAPRDMAGALEFKQRAEKSQQQGQYAEALFYLMRALVFDPQDVDLLNETGLMAEATGNFRDAEYYYQEAIRNDPEYLPSYYNLGVLYVIEKKYDLAQRYFQYRVLKGNATDPWTLRAQEKLEEVYQASPTLQQERLQDIAKDFEQDFVRQRIIDRQETETRKLIDIEDLYQAGVSSFQNRDYWLAVSLFEEAHAMNPDDENVTKALGRAREQLRRQTASADLEMAIQEYRPEIMELYLNAASKNTIK